MLLPNGVIGGRVSWSIGSDLWPAVISSDPIPSYDAKGRPIQLIEVIVQRTSLAGETYTKQQLVNSQYLTPRVMTKATPDGEVVPHLHALIDGDNAKALKPVQAVISEHLGRIAAYRSTQVQTNDLSALQGVLSIA